MCIDSRILQSLLLLFTFLLSYIILFCHSQRQDDVLRCNLLFGLLGRFGLLFGLLGGLLCSAKFINLRKPTLDCHHGLCPIS